MGQGTGESSVEIQKAGILSSQYPLGVSLARVSAAGKLMAGTSESAVSSGPEQTMSPTVPSGSYQLGSGSLWKELARSPPSQAKQLKVSAPQLWET